MIYWKAPNVNRYFSLALFSATLFLSAFLLFSVQLLFAKMILPLMGGTAAVWNTCQVFFLSVLLLGYSYSHCVTRYLNAKQQGIVQIVLMLTALGTLPIEISGNFTTLSDYDLVFRVLTLMLVSLGLPFFTISAIGPLLQKWFFSIDQKENSNPYFLYAASNFGSLAGLISYPTWIESNYVLSDQRQLWFYGYGLLVFMVSACAVTAQRYVQQRPVENSGSSLSTAANHSLKASAPSLREQIGWVFRAFIPSSLSLSLTTYITTDIAPVPLFWAVTLSIYLVTFILVFTKKPFFLTDSIVYSIPFLVAILIGLMNFAPTMRNSDALSLHLLTFIIVGWTFHGLLAQGSPDPKYLTLFYFCLSLGGALGGVFNAIIAPTLFNRLAEYQLLLVIATLSLPSPRTFKFKATFLTGLLSLLAIPTLAPLAMGFEFELSLIDFWVVVFGLFLYAVSLFVTKPDRKTQAIGLGLVILLSGQLSSAQWFKTLVSQRSFFGIHRIGQLDNKLVLMHGTTIHGSQNLKPKDRTEPLTYYYPQGPLGQVFQILWSNNPEVKQPLRVATLGLGTGTIAAYGREGDEFDFLEIDSVVQDLAMSHFSFLSDSRAKVSIKLGDGRLLMKNLPSNRYNLIIVDAFSSDSVPVHLLTREAILLYLDKLREDGVILFNVSNRYLDLVPVLGAAAESLDITVLNRVDKDLTKADYEKGYAASTWVALMRPSSLAEALFKDPRWQEVHSQLPVWTDDFSNILSVFNRRTKPE